MRRRRLMKGTQLYPDYAALSVVGLTGPIGLFDGSYFDDGTDQVLVYATDDRADEPRPFVSAIALAIRSGGVWTEDQLVFPSIGAEPTLTKHEVPSIAKMAAPMPAKWICFCQRMGWEEQGAPYLNILGVDYSVGGNKFLEAGGGIVFKTATTPGGAWSAAVTRTFAQWNTDSGLTADAYTEPAAFFLAGRLYLVLVAIDTTPASNDVVVFSTNDLTNWTYEGIILSQADADLYGYSGWTAPNVFGIGAVLYMNATGIRGGDYKGTHLFRVASLATPSVIRNGGRPVSRRFVPTRQSRDDASFGGASYYDPVDGFVCIENVIPLSPLILTLWKTARHP